MQTWTCSVCKRIFSVGKNGNGSHSPVREVAEHIMSHLKEEKRGRSKKGKKKKGFS